MAITEEAQPPIVFLGWETPLPQAAAAHLISRWPTMDFTSVSVVVSGGRAGRRILTILADIARENGLAMVPPDIFTIGELPERLYRPAAPVAGPFLRQIAWVGALRRSESAAIAALFPRLVDGAPDLPPWQGAAAMLERCNDELAAGALDFSAIAERAATSPGLGDIARWEAAERLQLAYLRALRAMGLCDLQYARRQAIADNAVKAPGPIVLVGVAELNRQTEQLLDRVKNSVQSLVFAPAELAEGFNAFGCVKSDYWQSRHIDLDGTRLEVARTVSDQAAAVFTELAALGPSTRTDQVTIGAADESIVPHLETTSENLDHVPVRFAGGVPIAQTRPYQLLKVIADYLESGEFQNFSVLIRHPDLERWLNVDSSLKSSADGNGQAATADPAISLRWRDWKTLLDRYAEEYIPVKLGPEHRTADAWRRRAGPGERGYSSRSGKAADDRHHLAWLYGKVEDLLGEMRSVHADGAATADQWAVPILALLKRAYGSSWNQDDERQRLIVLACMALRDALGEMHDAGQVLDRSRFPNLLAHEAIRCLLGLVSSRRLAPPLTGDEIELVGWLELMPDDAPHLIITGFNEGHVPESAGVNPLINDTVRETLGLVRDRDRLARDAYLLTAMTRSRPRGAVTLLTGRVSTTGDPLLPSRLVFACEPVKMAKRVLTAIAPPPRRLPLALRFNHAARGSFERGVTAEDGLAPITSMSVTSFRDYLASPQGFYLRHVVGLKTLDEVAPREMDPSQCGMIVHQVLKNFAATPAASSNSSQECIDCFSTLLDQQVLDKYSHELSGPLKFQVEMIRRRLAIFAERQAKWFSDGWRIFKTEWAPEDATLTVDRSDMGLRGQIDRIDYNERFNEWAILDYKVASGEKRPERAHLSKGQWCDLQLPLYRHLAHGVVNDRPVRLGYVVVSDIDYATQFALAKWDADMLRSADQAAADVVRNVRKFNFADIGENPPIDGIFGHIFGEGILMLDPDEEAAPADCEEPV